MDTPNPSHFWSVLVHLLGLDLGPEELSFPQMTARTVVVFIWAIVLLNFAFQRVVGRSSGSDVILLVVLGSVISRAINGEAAFFATLGASTMLVGLYRVLMSAAFRFHIISVLAKGRDCVLVRDGRIDWSAMRRARVTMDDLLEHLRLNGLADVDEVREARLERSGNISVLKLEREGRPASSRGAP